MLAERERGAAKAGTGRKRRAVHRVREGAREVRVAHGLGGDRVHRAGEARRRRARGAPARRRRRGATHDIHCRPEPSAAAEPEPEGGRHQRERAALRARARRRSGATRARTPCASTARAPPPPTSTQSSARKPAPGGARLVERLLAAVAVVADRRRAHEDAGALAGRERARSPRTSAPRRVDAARADPLAARARSGRPPKIGSPARWTTARRAADARLGHVDAVPADRLDAGLGPHPRRRRGVERAHRDRRARAERATSAPPTSPSRPDDERRRRRARRAADAAGANASSTRSTPRAVDGERRDHRRRDAGGDERGDLLAARLGAAEDRDAVDEVVGHRGGDGRAVAAREGRSPRSRATSSKPHHAKNLL